MPDFNDIATRERNYLLNTYARYPLVIARGKGVHVFDIEGRRYLDFVGGLGVNALGHAHPRIVRVIREQAAKVIHISNLYYNEYQGLLAEKLCTLSGLDRAFFSNSGTEAIEGALKLVRAAGHATGGADKCVVVALENSFHGRTMGALALTGQAKYRKDFDPMLEGVRFVPRNDVEALRAAVDDSVCAIILEPIQGEGGIQASGQEFLAACRELADRHQAALIFDEIQCGLGRTGHAWAYQASGVVPDALTTAKALGGGLPIGALITGERLADVLQPGDHGSTFPGGPVVAAAALAVLDVLLDPALHERIQDLGARLLAELAELPRVTAARGVGLMLAVELETGDAPDVVRRALLEHRLVLNATGPTTIRLLPPLIVTDEELAEALRRLRAALESESQV